MKRLLSVATAAIAIAFASASSAQTPPPNANVPPFPAPVVKKPMVDTPQRVLFIGNSLMYYNGGLQTHLHRMALALDPKYDTIRAGFKSVHITSASLEPFPVEYLTNPANMGAKEPYQVAVLAPSARDAMTEKGRAVYRQKVLEWDAAMKKYGSRVALIWLQPFVKPNWDQENYRRNGELVIATANEVGAQVIPIGPAFEMAYRLRPGLKLQMEYDGYHPTVAGQYLSSAVTFAALYGRSPEGSKYTYFGALDNDTAAFLQKVANDTVQAFFAQ
jgi:hypothetical protein